MSAGALGSTVLGSLPLASSTGVVALEPDVYGTVSGSLPVPGAALAGGAAHNGGVASSLPLPVLYSLSQTSRTGTLDAQLPVLGGDLSAEASTSGILTAGLITPTMLASGRAVSQTTGSLAIGLPRPRAVIRGRGRLTLVEEIVLQKVRIQNALTQAIRLGTFYPLSYDRRTGLASVNPDKTVAPAQTLVNEIQSFFEAAKRTDKWRRERSGWIWQAVVTFQQEVTLETFEHQISFEKPLKIPSDGGLRPVLLELTQTDYSHPPQQQPSAGTHVVFTFEATILPS